MSSTTKLETDAELVSAIEVVTSTITTTPQAEGWYRRAAKYIQTLRDASSADFESIDFLTRMWDDEAITSTGNGTVNISPALADDEFRNWFVSEIVRLRSVEDMGDITAQLVEFYDSARNRLRVLCKRTPRLKLNRVLCGLFPTHFTSIGDVGSLSFLYQAMGGARNVHPVLMHKEIRTRIDNLLGPVESKDMVDYFARVALPWALVLHVKGDSELEQAVTPELLSNELVPMAADLRRKGLSAIKGNFTAVLELLPELKDGVSRVEFEDLVRQANPSLSKISVGANIGVLSRELDLCRRVGDLYQLSPRGINLLESRDPDELSDHLLTKVFGVDHILVDVGKKPSSKGDLITHLQSQHAGWTTPFAPTALVAWLTSLDVLATNKEGKYELTERGLRWRELIHWVPEKTSATLPQVSVPQIDTSVYELPGRTELLGRLKKLTEKRLSFDDELVHQLHAGLWSHPVRHFAVLTGLSGSGKTQLALNYGRALCNDDTTELSSRVAVVPVQPGWYDPSAILGYVNPLQESSYRSTSYLNILLQAADRPNEPHVVILDEMNLSHPEQYLAPILSAMETQDWIELHDQDETLLQIPQRIRYPANLAIIGTVNMDETTHGLSDKVLDRAFTLEFWAIDVQSFPGWTQTTLAVELRDRARDILTELSDVLKPVRQHFGWRTIDDVVKYLEFSASFVAENTSGLDDVIYAKVLPKLRGERSRRFVDALNGVKAVLDKYGLTRCSGKVSEMKQDLDETGATRYWR